MTQCAHAHSWDAFNFLSIMERNTPALWGRLRTEGQPGGTMGLGGIGGSADVRPAFHVTWIGMHLFDLAAYVKIGRRSDRSVPWLQGSGM